MDMLSFIKWYALHLVQGVNKSNELYIIKVLKIITNNLNIQK